MALLPGHPNPKTGRYFVDWLAQLDSAIGGYRATAVAAQAAYDQAAKARDLAAKAKDYAASERHDAEMGRAERTIAHCAAEVDRLLEERFEATAGRDREV